MRTLVDRQALVFNDLPEDCSEQIETSACCEMKPVRPVLQEIAPYHTKMTFATDRQVEFRSQKRGLRIEAGKKGC